MVECVSDEVNCQSEGSGLDNLLLRGFIIKGRVKWVHSMAGKIRVSLPALHHLKGTNYKIPVELLILKNFVQLNTFGVERGSECEARGVYNYNRY